MLPEPPLACRSAPLEKFLGDLASRTPTPGGGSASALAGAVGAALGSMSSSFTTGHEKFLAVEPQARELHRQFELLRLRLLELMDRDIASYQGVVEARKLPKASPAEKEARAARLAAAHERCTQVPEEILKAAAETSELVLRLVPICNPNLLTDAAAAAGLLAAAAQGACLQVLANLAASKENAAAGARMRAARALARTCEELRAKVERETLRALGLSDDT